MVLGRDGGGVPSTPGSDDDSGSSGSDDSVGGGTGLGDDTQDTGARGGGGSVDAGSGFDSGGDDRSTSSGGSTTRSPDPVRETATVGVGSGPTPGDVSDGFSRDTIGDFADGFSQNVAEPVGDAARFASPATELDRFVPGSPVGRTVEGFNEGAVEVLNPAAAAEGGINIAESAVEDTRNVEERGDAGRRQNRRDAANAVSSAALGFAGSVGSDPVGTLSRTGGSLVGGAIVGSAAARGARGVTRADADSGDAVARSGSGGSTRSGSGDVDDVMDGVDAGTPSTEPGIMLGELGGDIANVRARLANTARRYDPTSRTQDSRTVPSGRSDVGTGGVDSVLDADLVDEARGVSGPSRTARARGSVSRGVDDVRSGLDDIAGDFLEDTRGQTGQFRRPDSPDETPSAPRDFNRVDDRVSDNLVQQSLNRQQRAGRQTVDGGDFEIGSGSDPFGPGTRRGTISESGDVDLGRSTGIVDEPGATTGTQSGAGAGVDAGLGGIAVDPANDPSGITDFDDDALGGGANADTDSTSPTAGTTTGVLAPENDPTSIAVTPDTGAGSDVGGVSDTGVEPETGTEPEIGTDPVTDTDAGTDQPPVTRVTVEERARVGPATAPGLTTPTTVSVADPIETTDTTGTPATPGIPRAGGPSTRTPRARRRDDVALDDEEEIDPLGVASADFLNPTRGLDAASANILEGLEELGGRDGP